MEPEPRVTSVSGELRKIEERVREHDERLITAWDSTASQRALVDALKRAVALAAVSPHFRLRFNHSYERLTLHLAENRSAIRLGWEHIDGTHLLDLVWESGESFAEVMFRFKEAVRVFGDEYGAQWVDADHMVGQITSSLRVAIESRNGRGRALDPVLEVFGSQWSITEYGIECLTEPYTIPVSRMQESDWVHHMRGKVWVDDDAFEDAHYTLTEMASGHPERFPSLPARDEGSSYSGSAAEVEGEDTPMVAEDMAAENTSIFIVHGHDDGLKDSVARLLERITSLDVVVLHEQTDGGRTIIEKFEAHAAGACFAVVLMTPDDEVHTGGEPPVVRQARPNVLLELGYFLGQLGRDKVTVLRKPDTQMPSDFGGVLYKTVDTAGAWRLALARELSDAGISIDWNGIPT